VLKTIKDPELDINIVDLGLLKDIEILDNNRILITIIFTSSFCPLADYIIARIEQEVKKIQGVTTVEVKVDKDTIWNYDMMTEKGKKKIKGLLW